METMSLKIDPVRFDMAIGVTPGIGPVLKQAGDIEMIVKPNGTEGGKPVVAVTFLVQLPDGTFARAQATTTAALIESAGAAMKGWREGGHI